MSMLDNLPTTYEPQNVETQVRENWDKGGFFVADPTDTEHEPYTIVIPPPNVTGALHGGHALNNTLQDILIRWRRMQGRNTMWMPGTDHAGIATQAVVERKLFEEKGLTRHSPELGKTVEERRTALIKEIENWKDQYGNRIINQLKLMGCSCDWSRTRFTLDDVCAKAVRHTFFKLFRDGLIVRGKRLVNWDTHLQTAVADDEVYHETVKGHFYHFKYPVIDPKPGEPEFVHIATTRPETMLGDTAVAVHPDPQGAMEKSEQQLREALEAAPVKEKAAVQAELDALIAQRETKLETLIKLRDMALDGRKVLLPLVDRPIPLVADIWAKPELGSGCVKITPAHDPNDYEVGLRQELPRVNVMSPDGKIGQIVEPDGSINKHSEKYEGLKFSTAGRNKVVEDLEALGLVEKIEDRQIDIGHSDRSKTAIEPYLSDQWFVRMGDLPGNDACKVEGLRGSSGLAQLAMDQICEQEHADEAERKACGKVHFFPTRYAKTYLDWLKEKRDWCISRQLWWGHRIPVWSVEIATNHDNPEAHELSKKLFNTDLFHITADPLQNGEVGITRIVNKDTGELYNHTEEEINSQQLVNYIKENKANLIIYCCLIKDDENGIDRLKKGGFKQDPDVLDTWFSSALWPHSTMGWPDPAAHDETRGLLDRYYPGSVLSTAREIITLWVARMVLTGMYNLGQVPFHDVYIHSVIQDGQGRPFKKTLGNGFDPVDIIEVYGADALRYTMANCATETQDIRMPMKKVKLDDGRELQSSERFELGRNFCNKLWNAARFAFMNLEGAKCVKLDIAALPIEDRWILSRVSRVSVEVQEALATFQFNRAINIARDFFWDSLCDWYLELVKSRIRDGRKADEARQVLAFALDQSLRLLHPFIPFITEKLWSILNEVAPQRGLPGAAELETPKALIVAPYPPADGYHALDNDIADTVFGDLQTATRAVRDIRQKQNVPVKDQVNVAIKVPADRVASLEHEAAVIRELARVGELTVGPEVARPNNAASLVIGDMQIYVADVIDTAAEKQRLEKELANLDKQIGGLEGKLANENFTSRAPTDLVERERARLADLAEKRRTVLSSIQELG